jgi:hypothetical protein
MDESMDVNLASSWKVERILFLFGIPGLVTDESEH